MYKLGFIGGGYDSIAGYPHYIASQMDNRFEVVAGVFSSNKDKSKETSKRWKVNHYDTIEEMLNNEQLDAVSILTPTPMHYDNIQYLLKKSIPIICEKPLVSSYEDSLNLEKILKNNFLAITNNYSGYPMIRELKEQIKNDTLGDILSINLQMPQETFLRPPKNIKYPQPWRLSDGYIPMISLDLGTHLHHISSFLLGEEPSELVAEFNSFSNYDVIDDVKILLRYKNNKNGMMWFSKSALGHRNGLSVEVYGTKASASWVQENSEQLNISYNDGTKTILDRSSNCFEANKQRYNRMTPGHPSGFIEAFANTYNDIADLLDAHYHNNSEINKSAYSLNHAVNGLKLLHKATISYEQNKWIKVN